MDLSIGAKSKTSEKSDVMCLYNIKETQVNNNARQEV